MGRKYSLPCDALLWDPGLWFEWNDECRYHILADNMSRHLCWLLHWQLHRLLFRYNTHGSRLVIQFGLGSIPTSRKNIHMLTHFSFILNVWNNYDFKT